MFARVFTYRIATRIISWCVNFRFFVGNVKTTKIYTLLITVIIFVSHKNDNTKQLMTGIIKVASSEVRSGINYGMLATVYIP